jgi:ATP-dependent Lon protease
MEKTENKTLSEKIAEGLRRAMTELEELQVQAALGKAEAKDLYEDAKKKFNAYMNEASRSLKESASKLKTDGEKVKTLLDEIQVQLALGKAETKEVFEEQRTKLLAFIAELEDCIRNNKGAGMAYTELFLELEKFKLKLGILKLKYELKKMAAKEEFEEKKKYLKDKINGIKDKLFEGEDNEKWEHFQKEMGEAYKHLKHAFTW